MVMNVSHVSTGRLVTRLADPALTASLSHFVRARVPDTAVEDIVQSTLAEALAADGHPEQDEDIVRWVHGICRHKVADWFRKGRREVPRDLEGGDEGGVAAAESAPQGAMDLLRWAEKELPEGEENAKTLEWMLREGEGEKLESIAAEANLPAPRVRQRVSRLRRYYKARWAAQAAALAALLLIAIAIALAFHQKRDQVAPAPGPSLVPSLVPAPPPTAPDSVPPESPALSTDPPAPPAPSREPSQEMSLKPPPFVPTQPVPTARAKPRGKESPTPKPSTLAPSAAKKSPWPASTAPAGSGQGGSSL
jgi:DNA-directed RNA polymerase specialized sigma24 family protein